MATVTLFPMRYVGALGGGSVGMNAYVQDALKDGGTATYKKGELVTVTTAGVVTKADATIVGASGTNDKLDVDLAITTIAKKIAGVAFKDEAAVATVAPFGILVPGSVLVGNLVAGQVGDTPTNYTLLATDIMRKVALLFSITNRKWYFTTNAGEECATIIGFPGMAGFSQTVLGSDAGNEGGVGDTNARVFCVIDNEITKFGAIST